jgi:hypothetical protein
MHELLIDTARIRKGLEPYGEFDDLERPLMLALCDEIDRLRERNQALTKALRMARADLDFWLERDPDEVDRRKAIDALLAEQA